jgi:epoxyqueuosine reductase
MDIDKSYDALKKFAKDLGLDLFGVADIRKAKQEFVVSPELLAKLDKAVVLGGRLSRTVLAELVQAPTRLYSYHYRTLNSLLDQSALKTSLFIESQGYLALPIPTSQILDWKKQTGHLSHKKMGVLAGLGWIGRNNMLVNKEFGSQFRLATILTNMPLKIDQPSTENCGSCYACIKACPAAAIKEDYVDFEHVKCFDAIKGFQKLHLAEQYICGVCVNVCRGQRDKNEKLHRVKGDQDVL